MSYRAGLGVPRSGPAFSGARKFRKNPQNGGLRRQTAFAGARQLAAAAVAANGELKFHDVDLDDAVVANGGTVTATVNIIPQGVEEAQRVGRKCVIRNIMWRYNLNLPVQADVADLSGGDIVRVIMYLDRQANKATAAVTDLLEVADFQSFNNLGNKGRFLVLHDNVINLNRAVSMTDGTNTASSPQVVSGGHTFFKKCNIPIEFTGATGAIGEITSNNIGVILISSSGIAGFGSKIRLRYTDQ